MILGAESILFSQKTHTFKKKTVFCKNILLSRRKDALQTLDTI